MIQKLGIIKNKKTILWILLFAVAGASLLVYTKAASGPSVAVEAENASLSGNAAVGYDSTASGGSYIILNSSASYSQIGTSNYLPGVTITQDTSGYSSYLAGGNRLVNQHFYSFGASGSDSDWYSLDRRMNVVLSNFNSGVILTACCSPPSLKQDASKSSTDTPIKWIDSAGYSESGQTEYQKYANMIGQAVARYPKVQYVQVWNEMKGYFENNFYSVPGHAGGDNYKKYTILYNLVYDAVKKARSSVKVGGPYVVMHSMSKPDRNWAKSNITGTNWGYIDARDVAAVKYWWAHKRGADFIALDIKNHNVCKDPNIAADCPDPEVSSDPFKRMDKYQAIANWVRKSSADGGLGAGNLPIIWSEWYARNNPIIQGTRPDDSRLSDSTNKAFQGTVDKRNALMSTGLIKVVKSGVLSALIWGAQGLGSDGIYHPLGIYNAAKTAPTKFYTAQKCVKDYFSAGTKLYDPKANNSNVETLATISGTTKRLLLVNKKPTTQSINVFGKGVTLGGYEAKCINNL